MPADHQNTGSAVRQASPRSILLIAGDGTGKKALQELLPSIGYTPTESYMSEIDVAVQVLEKTGWPVARESLPRGAALMVVVDDDYPIGRLIDFVDDFIVVSQVPSELHFRLRLLERRVAQARELGQGDSEHQKPAEKVISELAGAIAHELNQPLTSVTGYAELLLGRLTDPESVKYARVIYTQAKRIAEVVVSIGNFKHPTTVAYVGNTRIVDFTRASPKEEDETPRGPQK